MGLLIVDHSAFIDPATGLPGKKLEFDTISCCHCQSVIKIVLSEVESAHNTRFRCGRCKKPMCRRCAEVLNGICHPIQATVEEALRRGGPREIRPYQYKILPNK